MDSISKNRPDKWMYWFASEEKRTYIEFKDHQQVRISVYDDSKRLYNENLTGINAINVTGTTQTTAEPKFPHETNKWNLIIDLLLGTGGVKHFYDIGRQKTLSLS